MKNKFLKGVVASFALAVSGIANAGLITLDFDSLEQVNNSGVGSSYAEEGFLLSASNLFTIGTSDFRYTGSVSLLDNTANGITQLTKIGGGTFDLFSIDVAELNGPNVASITFTRDGGHSQTFTLDGDSFGVETFFFNSGFLGATTISWVQQNPYHQFDNIKISQEISEVPEPSTLAVFALGLMGLASRKFTKQA